MLPPLRAMIGQLLATPSISSVDPHFDTSNAAVCELLAGWLEALGFDVRLLPVPDRAGKVNLIATLGRGPGGLVLSGHADTVPWDEGRWSVDPFRATERDGRLYGLGSADMKSFFAIALDAIRDVSPRELRAPLIVLATADEESSMSGARALVAAGEPRARYALIGEPTALEPVYAHKGILMESLRVRGRAAHSSDPSLGRNAIDGMHKVIAALMRWRDTIARRYRDARFAVPVPTLNFGALRGGDNPNRVCALCELLLDVRLVPGLDAQTARAGLREAAREALTGSGLEIDFDAVFEGVEAHETAADSELLAACEAMTGHARKAVGFGTEAPFLAALGMDTVVLGPGDIAQAHQPDEYLPLASLAPARVLLRDLVARFCR